MPNATTVIDLSTLKELALDRLAWARRFTLSLIESLSDEQLIARAGGSGNHALWVMGHIAFADDHWINVMTGTPSALPPQYLNQFAAKTTPSANPADYPSRAELLQVAEAARERVIGWVQSLDEESAIAPTPEETRMFAPNAISVAFSLAAHDMMHAGQVATVRASLGIPPLHV